MQKLIGGLKWLTDAAHVARAILLALAAIAGAIADGALLDGTLGALGAALNGW